MTESVTPTMTALVEHICGEYAREISVLAGVGNAAGIIEGIALTLAHPEYAVALLRACEREGTVMAGETEMAALMAAVPVEVVS